jgi:hypothetical protein
MPSWFTPTVILLAILALAFLVAVWKTRKRKYTVALGGTLAALLLVWLLAYLIPTDQKRIEHAINEMAAGVNNKDLDRTFKHISNDFRARSLDKASLRSVAEGHIKSGNVDHINIINIEKVEVNRPNKTADVEMRVKPIGPAGGDLGFYLVRAKFVLEDGDQWRMRSFEIFNPVVETDRPMQVPGLP